MELNKTEVILRLEKIQEVLEREKYFLTAKQLGKTIDYIIDYMED